ncbi:hypothetical protein G5B47_12120 [Paenibacillus sp. 7124]|uniref:Uncharacterized protein n=1 Tax=Paenibacillus apii TaxID=1850370 RepID=A0A6M1PIY8_9BACL|nr:hypothetical protein [Paenibacillus apii]NGM83160.1 hypothetical protein [Paenibacillus apii]NJJ38808.1 hypothetical protein [Paenibacillus apii]
MEQVIYWIGGSACAGKSIIARQYAKKRGFDLYSCDEYLDRHLRSISASNQPAMHKVSRMTYNEAFYIRSVQEQLKEYIEFFKEDFTFVLRDLEERSHQSIIVEGNQLLPSLVAPCLNSRHKAIWLIPTEPFQRHHYRKREWIQEILDCTDDPVVAFDKWMTRDAGFAAFVEHEALELNLDVLKIDGSKNLQQTYNEVEEFFNQNEH